MARTTSYRYTNTGDAASSITPKDLKLTSNYAMMRDNSDVVQLSNKTAPIDAEELIELRSRYSSSVATNLNVQHPAKVGSAIEYSIRVDANAVTTDSTDPEFRVDHPTVCTIAFRHERSGDITEDLVAELLMRAVSGLRKADGTWRMGDLMRSAERPIAD